ncbi:MAG: adenosylcobalamin-dependent ribonucleoside-diphosphate reductase [Gammaproteobacteria bacterium]
MSHPYLDTDIARHIWETKYRFRDENSVHDHGIEDTWRRIATALASVETDNRELWRERFYDVLRDFLFLPGGRIQAGAGTARRVTLLNCFVMGVIEDSMDSIFDGLKQGAVTMQQGGGVGYDFSTLRPRGTPAHASGTIASGPVSFMRIWDRMCATVLSTGARRGAMMATLRCDHPDIEEFIAAKRTTGELTHFNLSVLVTDELMQAVREDRGFALVFPADRPDEAGTVLRQWTGCPQPVPCRVVRQVRARELWRRIMRATYDYAEPGILFVDRINQLNNLYYREQISATNPCGEIPLPPYGACDLGSINLTRFVREPFGPEAQLDLDAVRDAAQTATRMLDNVLQLSRYPLPAQAEQAHGSRRIGLGLTGLADVLIMLGLRYDQPRARDLAQSAMRTICHAAYRTSVDLARERGSFPYFEREHYLAAPFINALPDDIRDGIARFGIRNSHLTAIAPTGTISLLAGNVSGGLEPVFDFRHQRRVLEADGSYRSYELTDFAYRLWRQDHGPDAPLPDAFTDARHLPPQAHLDMQTALQPYVDNAISKTINIPGDFPFEQFLDLYQRAYDAGLKGCTTFRPNPVTGEVLSSGQPQPAPDAHCCSIEREAD